MEVLVTSTEVLFPVLALIGWTFVMWAWLYATRIPAMQKAKVDVAEISRTGASLELPPEVTRVADNYNHLHEQPTLFYALAITTALLGAGDNIQILLAWTYVVLRIVHSVVQATRNIIIVRFSLFALASIVLFVMFTRTVLSIL